jgi:hypothetical protein
MSSPASSAPMVISAMPSRSAASLPTSRDRDDDGRHLACANCCVGGAS